ncbi:MAG TPA: hypothetical protein VFU98_09770 [Microlunatus sp.]|nr:hypothetical protein [Microlunatus sp.]
MNSRARGGVATVSSTVCESCGAANPVGASFCHNCSAFIGWDHTAVLPDVAAATSQRTSTGSTESPRPEEAVETRVMPKITDGPVPIVDPAPVLAVRAEQSAVTVPVTGARAELVLTVTNRSDIVDGYEVDAGGAPDWLAIDSRPLRLLPGSEGGLVLGFRISSDSLVPAGRSDVQLRVRSLTQPPGHEILTVTVEVPVVDAPVRLRTEPSVVRLADVEVGRFVVVVDNSGANRPCEIRLSGSDPELAVDFHFDPALVTVPPGGSARVRAATTSARPAPGTELTRSLTVSATEGRRRVDATVTLLQSTSAVVEDPVVELLAEPSLLRVRDGEVATARVRVDNRAGRQWATVRLAATDAEKVVSAGWSTTELRVPPGGSSEAEVRLSCPVPEPGTEASHAVTVTASDGLRVARTQVTVVHTASASPMTTLGVQLDPSVLRLGTRRQGAATVVLDNRRGHQPVRVWLRGDDPENALRFTITPPELTIGPGQVATGRVAVTAPRAPTGRETTRPLTVTATDGRATATTDGTIVQTAGDRRPWARVLLTLAGALAMIVGAMLPLRAVSDGSSFDVGVAAIAGLFNASVDLGGFEQLVSFGLVILVLAGLLVFGLTGRSGRLSRLVALLTVALTVALLITIGLAGLSGAPGIGALLIIVGAVLGYVGGLLARR